MIEYFKNILHYIFKSKKPSIIIPNDNDILETEKYICEISFKLTENQEIDIEFLHTLVQDSSIEEIGSIAENCANLIVMINNGLLKKQLLGMIKQHKKNNMNNEKNTLLLDNILFFNSILQEELRLIRKENGPLVRPSSVFRS